MLDKSFLPFAAAKFWMVWLCETAHKFGTPVLATLDGIALVVVHTSQNECIATVVLL